jgi:hypothetical protein
MDINVQVSVKELDKLLNGKKKCVYIQIDRIHVKDTKGRIASFQLRGVNMLTPTSEAARKIMAAKPEMGKNNDIYRMILGEKISSGLLKTEGGLVSLFGD